MLLLFGKWGDSGLEEGRKEGCSGKETERDGEKRQTEEGDSLIKRKKEFREIRRERRSVFLSFVFVCFFLF